MSSERDRLPAIEVRNVSKVYRTYRHPSDRLIQLVYGLGCRVTHGAIRDDFARRAESMGRNFWALRDVSFEVPVGSVTAILGRNGAGKSTLLQIIANTMTPTAGEVHVRGKVAAILELGAGFNPDYTGRENVLLNAQLLGLSREEAERRLGEIVAFADIGDFIDQPVKTYSTGMQARLAFAVSVSVQPQVLIVDEALAVGDIGFQFKCFRRLERLKDAGTSILLVTHSTSMVLEHADRAVLLHQGEVKASGSDVKAVVVEYERLIRGLQGGPSRQTSSWESKAQSQAVRSHAELCDLALLERNAALSESRFGTHRAIIRTVRLSQDPTSPDSDNLLFSGQRTFVRVSIESSTEFRQAVLGASIRKAGGADLWGDNTIYGGLDLRLRPGLNVVEFEFDLCVSGGDYVMLFGLASLDGGGREELDQRWPLVQLSVSSRRSQVGPVYAPATFRIVEE